MIIRKYPAIGIVRHRLLTDGAGVTTLVASHGCTLRCKYCLNSQCLREYTKITYYTIPELLKTVSIDDLYFQATGGGLTFGGGEPLLQAEFLYQFLKECPEEWSVNLETSLAVPTDNLKLILNQVDSWLIDIKDMNPEIYKAYTGRTNDQVRDNLEYLLANCDPDKIRIRLPLIPEFNTEADVDASEKILRKMGFRLFDRFTYRVKARRCCSVILLV